MPELISVTRRLEKDDRIEGSGEKARAVWALGHLKTLSDAATVSRTIRARTAINWEGPQASRFFRRNPDSPLFVRALRPNGRYLFSLSVLGQQIFNEMFVSPGDVAFIKDHPGDVDPTIFRSKVLEADPVKQAAIIEKLGKENSRYHRLLTRIVTCHHGEVEAVLAEISTAVGVKDWRNIS